MLTAKILVTLGLTIFAWRNRTWWLPAARAHRVTAACRYCGPESSWQAWPSP